LSQTAIQNGAKPDAKANVFAIGSFGLYYSKQLSLIRQETGQTVLRWWFG
jgi:hypothetical protein